MAAMDNITPNKQSEEPWETFARESRERAAAEVSAFRVLHDCTPLEFAQRYSLRLKQLLGLLSPDKHDMPSVALGDLVWMAHDIAEQIEIAVDLLSEPVQTEGGTAA